MSYSQNRARTWLGVNIGKPLRYCVCVAMLLIVAYCLLIVYVRPSNERNWAPDQARLASAIISGDEVQISHVRHALYRSKTDFDVRWENRKYDLNHLDSVWYVVEPFADWRGPAHTFLSFGFSDGRYLAISVEIRKELLSETSTDQQFDGRQSVKSEQFSPLRDLLRQYELAYVVGDEQDLIGVRANHRHDQVYLYKMHATPEGRRALLLDMLKRANQLTQIPEFYNTLTNTCTSNIVAHIEHIAPGRIPWSYKTLLPAFSDDLAFDLGLIDTKLSRETYRAAHLINDLAATYANRADFSAGIRTRFNSNGKLRQ